MTQDKRQGHERRKGCSPDFSAPRTGELKACIVFFEPGAHHLPACAIRASKSVARRLRHARAKHADRQHRVGQRCIFIAPERTPMKRIPNATLHNESDSNTEEDIRLSIALRGTFEAKCAGRRMTVFQCIEFAQAKPGVFVSVADCHLPRLAGRSCSPWHWASTDERTNGGWSERQANLRRHRPVANSQQTGKLPVAFTPAQAL